MNNVKPLSKAAAKRITDAGGKVFRTSDGTAYATREARRSARRKAKRTTVTNGGGGHTQLRTSDGPEGLKALLVIRQ